jgi:aminoglycoside phosphotransferase (APT) family kinase protein
VEPEESIDPLLSGIAGTRLDWYQVPSGVRESIEQYLGRTVTMAFSQAGGFSPALASRLTLDDGTGAFVKAIAPDEVSGAPGGQEIYRREARIAGALPNAVPAPRLLASMEPDGWVVLIFEEIVGSPPALPWQPAELSRVLDAMATLASLLTPSPIPAPPATVPGGLNGWASLCADPSSLDELPGLDAWVRTNVELLSEVASTSDSAHQGSTLLHTDIRADNVLLTAEGVVFVDWPHAKIGAPWVDLVYFLPSVAMQGGGDPQMLFWDHPLGHRADLRAVCSVLAGVAGFFIYGATREPPPGLPTLRRFQLAQGIEALSWLRRMMA